MKTVVTDDHIFVKPPYVAKDHMKYQLNATWVKAHGGTWRLPKNMHVMRDLLKSFPELRANNTFMEAGVNLKTIRNTFLNIKSKEDVPGDPRLRPYQRVDVAYLKRIPCAGIFNEQRTGKTPTAITLMKELETRKNLIVSPASLIWNWEKEIRVWYSDLQVFVVHGTPKKRESIFTSYREYNGKKVLIVSKDTWKRVCNQWDDVTFDLVLVDEAHFLRNRESQQTKAVVNIKAKRRYALTGTPTVSRTEEIFGILQFLYPKKFTSYWDFFNRYFEKGNSLFSVGDEARLKPWREQELQELIGFMSVQRKRKEVMRWLPDKEYMDFYVEMDAKQRKLYNQMLDSFMSIDEETGHIIDTPSILTQLTRMRQICLDPGLLGFDCKAAKTDALLQWMEDNREPVVVMSMFTSYLVKLEGILTEKGHKVGMIHGKMSNQQKFQAAQDFQTGKTDVLLCNIISAGTGFTLDRAEVIIFLDKAWNPAENEQAQDRITPTTQANVHKHTVISLVCKDSYDEVLNDLLKKKKSLTDVINEGGTKAIRRLLGGENRD